MLKPTTGHDPGPVESSNIFHIFLPITYLNICDRGTWWSRTNEELDILYGDADIVTDIKIRRLEWLGHLIRMGNNRIPKVALDAKL